MNKTKTNKREGNILNQSEIAVNRRISQVYNLKLEDFDNEMDYDDYLEEKETVLFNLVHQINVSESEQKLEIFRQKNHKIIERRNAEIMERSRVQNKPQSLPLLGQIKFQSKVNRLNTSKRAMMSVQYNDNNFKTEIEHRLDEWVPNDPNVEVWDAGGLPQTFFSLRCKQELQNSLYKSS